MEENVSKKVRRAPWPEKSKLLAMEKYVEFLPLLTGKFKGCGAAGVSVDEKEKCWRNIADTVNAISDAPVTVEQVKKQITNIRQRANEKNDASRKTGGGPAATFTCYEQLWLDSSSKKAAVNGLQVSLDTEGDVDTDEHVTLHDSDGYKKSDVDKMPCAVSVVSKQSVDLEVIEISNKIKRKERQKERSDKDWEIENLMLDNKRIKLDTRRIEVETTKLEMETAKIEKETIKIDKETEKLNIEIGNLRLKRSLLEMSVAKAAQDPLSVSLLEYMGNASTVYC